ncbi:MAG: type IX secretion system membrane protein PorP/SprF [Flavobacteriales bacterium]
MKHILIILSLLFCFAAKAQQDFQNTQYMFNQFVINPAYAGSKDELSVNLSHRSQWVGFEGAPQTQVFNIHAPLKKGLGAGMQVFNDQIGPRNVVGASAAFSYRIKMGKGKLGFGLRGGIMNYGYDWAKLNYHDMTDDVIGVGKESFIVPSFDFGTYYQSKTFYGGLEVKHLDRAKFPVKVQSASPSLDTEGRMYLHAALFLGKAFEINKDIALKTSVLMRAVENGHGYTDLNASIFLYRRIWAGVGARSNGALMVIGELYLTQNLRLAYSYDFVTSPLKAHQAGSHEIFIGYDINLFGKDAISPRYF